MLSANPLSDRKRWFDPPDTLMRVGLSTLASTFLIVLAPRVGTILLEIFVGILLVIRAFVVRARSRRATQLCLEFRGRSGLAAGLRGSRIRFLDRYELLSSLRSFSVTAVSLGSSARGGCRKVWCGFFRW